MLRRAPSSKLMQLRFVSKLFFCILSGLDNQGLRNSLPNDISKLSHLQSIYSSLQAYGQTKLANILQANELARRLKEEDIDITVNSLHPGSISTNLLRHQSFINGIVHSIGKLVLKNVEQGAATTCYVALHPQVKGVSGKYFMDNNVAQPTSQAQDADLAKKLWPLNLSGGSRNRLMIRA